jgi:hypothetical protein
MIAIDFVTFPTNPKPGPSTSLNGAQDHQQIKG